MVGIVYDKSKCTLSRNNTTLILLVVLFQIYQTETLLNPLTNEMEGESGDRPPKRYFLASIPFSLL